MKINPYNIDLKYVNNFYILDWHKPWNRASQNIKVNKICDAYEQSRALVICLFRYYLLSRPSHSDYNEIITNFGECTL